MTRAAPVTKTVQAYCRAHGLRLRDLFRALSVAVAERAAGRSPTPCAIVDEAPFPAGMAPEDLAWRLLVRALVQAVDDLAVDAGLSRVRPFKDPDAVVDALDFSVEQRPFTLDPEGFDKPLEQPSMVALFDGLRKPLVGWFTASGATELAAQSMATIRLPAYFVFALFEAWRAQPEPYAPLAAVFDTPFFQADDVERAWQRYRAWLQRDVYRPLFAEPFGLAQVYVRPRAVWVDPESEDERDAPLPPPEGGPLATGVPKGKRRALRLWDALHAWVDAGQDDALRVIAGPPGAGKTSLLRMFAAARAARGQRVIYVPVHALKPSSTLERSVYAHLQKEGWFMSSPFHGAAGPADRASQRLLVLFEGTDDLGRLGASSLDQARTFFAQLQGMLEHANADGLRLQAIIDGWDVLLACGESLLPIAPAQVMHLVPYALLGEDGSVDDPEGILKRDQREAWWKAYGAATGQPFTNGLPDDLARRELTALTAHPLSNYLVALAYGHNRIAFHEPVHRNELWSDLIASAYDRRTERVVPAQVRRHASLASLTRIELERMLQEVAIAAWHGDGRTAETEKVLRQAQTAGLDRLGDRLREELETGSLDPLLVRARTFSSVGTVAPPDPTDALAFTHQGFLHYLVARRLVEALDVMAETREVAGAGAQSAWDPGAALLDWVRLTGPSSLGEEGFQFLLDEVAWWPDERIHAVQDVARDLIERVVTAGIALEHIEGASFQRAAMMGRNAEEALLAVHWAAARVTFRTTSIEWPGPTVAGAWIARLQGQRAAWNAPQPIALRCLGALDFAKCSFYRRDLGGANLASADLTDANLQGANLAEATLTGANLTDANLSHANLSGADLRNADLTRCRIDRASLDRANLRGANLTGAQIGGSTLRRADLTDAVLAQAKLAGAVLSKAICGGASFEGANLRRANLTGAVLQGASLQSAVLRRANLSDANLSGANLLYADLDGANLQRADLENAYLHKANLTSEQMAQAKSIPPGP